MPERYRPSEWAPRSPPRSMTRPEVVLHGHWHHTHDSELSWIDRATTEESGALTWRSTRVVGLGCDSDTSGGWLVLDLPTLVVLWPSPVNAGS